MKNKAKEPLLYLVHRIPYPPNKGDKIRSYHMLKFFAARYKVFLGTFIDDPADNQYQVQLQSLCEECYFESLNPVKAKLKSLQGFLRGQALSVPYYSSAKMQQWVKDVIVNNHISKVVVFSSPMAQFVSELADDINKIMDFVDIDSDKWSQYSQSHKGLMSKVYTREAEYLFHYEKKIARDFNASLFVSDKEALLFREMVPEFAEKVYGISNGVDFNYFNPDIDYKPPYDAEKKVLVFTGAMDYWANCDAVIWFAREVFAKLQQKNNTLQFYIVGSNPSEQVLALSSQPGVFVTGRVEDVRPYIVNAFLSVAPLRIARGIQNKVLEAMAMRKMVIATENAMEGINLPAELRVMVADSAAEQIKLIRQLIESDEQIRIATMACEWIREKYSWGNVLDPLTVIIDGTVCEE